MYFNRRGFAVILALFTTTMLGALVLALVFAAAEETRASANGLRAARALSTAESAAWSSIEGFDWQTAKNLRPGQYIRAETQNTAGPATVFVARLDTTCFYIQASSSGSAGLPSSLSQRRVAITIELGADSAGRVAVSRLPYRYWLELF